MSDKYKYVYKKSIKHLNTHTAHYVAERLQKGCSYVAVQHCNIAGNISEMLQKSSYVRPCATLHEIFLQCFRDVIGYSPAMFRRFYSNFLATFPKFYSNFLGTFLRFYSNCPATFRRFYMRPTLYRMEYVNAYF